MDILVDNTLILYIQVTNAAQEKVLIERAVSDPKPLYYHPEFLQEYLSLYFEETGLEYVAQIDPDDFARWIFPHLFRRSGHQVPAPRKHRDGLSERYRGSLDDGAL